jgi:hypothetical protein
MATIAWDEVIASGQGVIGVINAFAPSGGDETAWLDAGSPGVYEVVIQGTRAATMSGGTLSLQVEYPNGATIDVPVATRTGDADDDWVFNDGGTTIMNPAGTASHKRLVALPTGRRRTAVDAGVTAGAVNQLCLAVDRV